MRSGFSLVQFPQSQSVKKLKGQTRKPLQVELDPGRRMEDNDTVTAYTELPFTTPCFRFPRKEVKIKCFVRFKKAAVNLGHQHCEVISCAQRSISLFPSHRTPHTKRLN